MAGQKSGTFRKKIITADFYDNVQAETTNRHYRTEWVDRPDATGWDDAGEGPTEAL